MRKEERLKAAFEYLKSQGKAHTQKDVAIKMKATPQNVSAALKGNPDVLTDNFLKRFNSAYNDIFNLDWLLNGDGDIIVRPVHQEVNGDNNTTVAGSYHINNPSTLDKAIDEISAQRKLVAKSQEQIDRLLAIIEKMSR